MDAWNVVLPILVAVLIGACIPLLFELWMTVKSARRVAERLDRVTARVEEGKRVDELLAAIDQVTGAARHLGEGVKVASAIGAALGPAIAGAVQGWRASSSPEAPAARESAPPRDGVKAVRQEAQEERP